MKELMKYLMRSKRGLWAAVGLPVIVLLGVCVLLALSEAIWGSTSYPRPLMYEFIAENLFDCLANIETAVLIGAGLGFLMLCANAFGFGTANGASRGSVFRAAVLSAVITATVITLMTRLVVYYFRYVYEEYTWNETLYMRFFFRHYVHAWDEETFKPILGANESFIRGSELFIRETVMFFVLALITLLCIAAIYALFRRLGLFGALCGVLGVMTCTALIVLLREFPDSLGALFFDANHSDVRENTVMLSPRTLPLLILVFFMTGAALLVFIKAIKRTGIKPQSL